MDAGAPCLRQSDGDGLLRLTRSMLALSDVMHLFAHKLAGLRRRRLPLALVLARPLHRLLLWHAFPLSCLVIAPVEKQAAFRFIDACLQESCRTCACLGLQSDPLFHRIPLPQPHSDDILRPFLTPPAPAALRPAPGPGAVRADPGARSAARSGRPAPGSAGQPAYRAECRRPARTRVPAWRAASRTSRSRTSRP